MKNIIILVTFMFVTFNFLSVKAQSQQLASVSERFSQFSYAEDDSLLFDGNYKNSNYFNKVREECNLKVTKVQGKVYGTIITTVIEDICGEIDTTQKLTYGLLKVGDIVASEQFLRTQDFSQLKEKLRMGKVSGLLRQQNLKWAEIIAWVKESQSYIPAGFMYMAVMEKRIE